MQPHSTAPGSSQDATDRRNSSSALASASAAPSAPTALDPAPGADDGGTHAALPDPSLPAPSLPPQDAGFTAADLIAHQARLEAQATEAIPFKFDTCTHSMGYIRQPVYACKTCGGGGVCAGCSISCHAEHDLVELFNKRHFRCDCGTPNLYRDRAPNSSLGKVVIDSQLEYPDGAAPCTLRKPGFEPQNEENRYSHNFEGGFCYCTRGRTYDPEKEEETMFQCLVCEEWLHEGCTSLRPAVKSNEVGTAERDEDEPPLIDHERFDLMICDACVRKPGNDLLRSYAGSIGWMVLLPTQQCASVGAWDGIPSIRVPTDESKLQRTKTDPAAATSTASSSAAAPQTTCEPAASNDEPSWQLFGLQLHDEASDSKQGEAAVERSADVAAPEAPTDTAAGPIEKRKAPEIGSVNAADGVQTEMAADKRKLDLTAGPSAEEEIQAAKRSRIDGAASERTTETVQGTACTLPGTMPLLASAAPSVTDDYIPALSKEAEATYSPPSDHDNSLRADDDAASVTSSTYDLGMAALRSMPREKMLDSLQAYNKFRDALWEHLRPFASSGKAVSEEDVRAFFRNQTSGAKGEGR
ncbi:hypothetical protein ACQY0O_001607 [Thecaphora frezii]